MMENIKETLFSLYLALFSFSVPIWWPLALCVPPLASLHQCDCSRNIQKAGNTPMVRLDYTTCMNRMTVLALFACRLSWRNRKCNHIHMPLHFLCLLPQKTRHKQGNLTAMQTPPYCKRKGGKSLDTWAYCKHCDSPLMVASCKVSGVPHIKQTGPRLIKWVWQTSTQTIYHFSMPPCEIKIRQPCVHTVQLSLLFFILWGRKKIQLLRQTVNYMIVCIIATQRLQFIVGM